MQDTEFVRRHPKLPTMDWDFACPIGFHGDAGSFNKQESVYLLSWNSLLGTGTTVAKRFVLTVLRKSHVTVGTIASILQICTWSMNALMSGIMPQQNWLGMPIRGGDWIAGG